MDMQGPKFFGSTCWQKIKFSRGILQREIIALLQFRIIWRINESANKHQDQVLPYNHNWSIVKLVCCVPRCRSVIKISLQNHLVSNPTWDPNSNNAYKSRGTKLTNHIQYKWFLNALYCKIIREVMISCSSLPQRTYSCSDHDQS